MSSSIAAGALSVSPFGTALGQASDSSSKPHRRHPLEGIERENIKITDVKVIPLSYVDPNENLWRTTEYVVWKTDGAITQIFTDQGIVGIGEGTPYEGPDYIKKFTEEEIKPLLLGKNPFDVELFTSRGSTRHDRAPWAGVDVALWDVIGKVKNKPVCELLATHGPAKKRIPIYASAGVEHKWYEDGDAQLIEEALRYKSQGYDCFKFRQGTDWKSSGMTLEKYIPILERLRQAVGPEFRLCHESMAGTGVPMERVVSEFCPALEELGFYWFEEGPGGTSVDDMDWFLKFGEAMPSVKISGGERFLNRFEAQIWLDKHALDIVQADCNAAGLTENWYISQMADQRGIVSIPHNWHGGGTTMANAHFVAGIPNGEYCELNQTYNPLKEGIFKEPLTVMNGHMEIPRKPGYGVELIDDIEKKFPYVPGSYLKPNPKLKRN